MSMLNLPDLRLLSALLEEPSLAAASRALHMSPSALSHRLSTLEDHLGVPLAVRRGRAGVTLTAQGRELARGAAELVVGIDAIVGRIQETEEISRTLRVAAPLGFGRQVIAGAISSFIQAHPRARFELFFADDTFTLDGQHFDLTVRVSSSRSVQHPTELLASNRRVLCAAPSLLEHHGGVEHPAELVRLPAIALVEDGDSGRRWPLSSDDETYSVAIDPVLSTNDGETAIRWALDGFGVVQRSEWSVAPLIRSGALVELLPHWSARDAPIVAVVPIRSRAVDLLLEHTRAYVTEFLGGHPAS
ncbi:MAG: LysR family transcriptional regulator [Myxococcota bacterium]